MDNNDKLDNHQPPAMTQGDIITLHDGSAMITAQGENKHGENLIDTYVIGMTRVEKNSVSIVCFFAAVSLLFLGGAVAAGEGTPGTRAITAIAALFVLVILVKNVINLVRADKKKTRISSIYNTQENVDKLKNTSDVEDFRTVAWTILKNEHS